MENKLIRVEKAFSIPTGTIVKYEKDITLFQNGVVLFHKLKQNEETTGIKGMRKKSSIILTNDIMFIFRISYWGPRRCATGKGSMFMAVKLSNIRLSTVEKSFKIVLSKNLTGEDDYSFLEYHKPKDITESFCTTKKKLKFIMKFNKNEYKEVLGIFHGALDKIISLKRSKLALDEINTKKDIFTKLIEWYSVRVENEEEKKVVKGFVACINVLREVLNSERDYVCDLSSVVNIFMAPLSHRFASNSKIDESLKTIFCNIGPILNVNAELLKAITDDINVMNAKEVNPSFESVSHIFCAQFMKHMDFLKMYSIYCHQYQENIIRLGELRSSNKDVDIQICIAETKTGKQLQSLLIKPVQRICKYPLLFQELLRNVNKVSQFQENNLLLSKLAHKVSEVYESLQQITNSVNTKVQNIENQKLVWKVFYELGGKKELDTLNDLIQPNRAFNLSAEVLVRSINDRSNTKRVPCVLYVFNDLLILAKISQGLLGRAFSGTSGAQISFFAENARANATANTSSNTTTRQRAKVWVKVPFDKYRIRVRRSVNSNNLDKQNRCPFQLITSVTDSVENILSTELQEYELWCESKDMRDKVSMALAKCIHKYQQELQAISLSKASHAKRISKEEFKKNPLLSLRERRLINTSNKGDLNLMSEKYKQNKNSFTATFDVGIIGVSFRNANSDSQVGRGILVALVTDNGQAIRQGIRLGDKLIRINSTQVKDSATWEQVCDVLKTVPRPVNLTFQRAL